MIITDTNTGKAWNLAHFNTFEELESSMLSEFQGAPDDVVDAVRQVADSAMDGFGVDDELLRFLGLEITYA